jgi:hypothetical protein
MRSRTEKRVPEQDAAVIGKRRQQEGHDFAGPDSRRVFGLSRLGPLA